jgi:hypothetical protein
MFGNDWRRRWHCAILDAMVWLGDGVRRLVLGAIVGTGCSARMIGDDAADDADGGASDEAATATDDGGSSGQCTLPDDAYLHYQFCLGSPTANGACECGPDCQMRTESEWYDQDCCGSCEYGYGGTECSEVVDGQCCFVTYVVEIGCGEGRPFVVEARPRVAAVAPCSDWTRGIDVPSTAGLGAAARMRLAEHWLAAARAEHASVASFARFTLQLLAHAAPPELVADAQRAALDEVDHARTAYALASAYAGRPLGPGGMRIEGSLKGVEDEAEVLRSLVREGCVDETIAATEAAVAAARAEDPIVRAALVRIAADEARHAALAWRTLHWMLQRTPSLASMAGDAFADAIARHEAPLPVSSDEGIPAHGILGASESARARAQCLARTIHPAIALLRGVLLDHGRGAAVESRQGAVPRGDRRRSAGADRVAARARRRRRGTVRRAVRAARGASR